MRFQHPNLLYLIILLIPGLVIFYYYTFKRKSRLQDLFSDVALFSKLTPNLNITRIYLKVILICISFGLFIVILARPQFGQKNIEVKRKGIDLIIAIDTSLSMLAEDLKPNRLELAKMELSNLIDRLKGDRIGIVAFSGDAITQCPLTLDYNAAKMFLDVIDTNTIAQPGTAIGRAIQQAVSSYPEGEGGDSRVMILLTDGEDHEGEPIEMARMAKKESVKIYTVGIGSSETGEPIPLRDEQGRIIGYKKDRSGQMIMSKLDEITLQRIAQETGGRYYRYSRTGTELDQIYKDISSMKKKELEDRLTVQYEDRYQFLLLIVIILLTVEFLLLDTKKAKKEWGGRFE